MWKIFHLNIFNPNNFFRKATQSSITQNTKAPIHSFACFGRPRPKLFLLYKRIEQWKCEAMFTMQWWSNVRVWHWCNVFQCHVSRLWYFVFNVLRSTLNANVLKYCQCQKKKIYWLQCFLFISWDQYCIQYFMPWG
jgi:hypothetical protein